MSRALYEHLSHELDGLKADGLYKSERVITSQQQAEIQVDGGAEVLNLCANNYLGLANHPALMEAAKRGVDERGVGVASVRFICGTQDLHKELEARLAAFVGTEDAILYAAAFDANGGLFEPLLGPDDAVISDQLNHASIIDGIRLCKARRLRYANDDMADLEAKLQEAQDALPPDRDRRRVLDGRGRREPGSDLRPGRALRRAGDGGRLPRHRLRR